MKKIMDGSKEVDAYLAKVPEPARGALEKLRATLKAALPKEATEGLSYGMPAFKLKSPVFGYAAFKEHCTLFPMSGSFLDGFAEDLKGYEVSKGGVRFDPKKPLPATLVRKLVKARVAGLAKPGAQ